MSNDNELKYSESDFKQRMMEKDLEAIAKKQADHIREEQKHRINHGAKIDNVEQMVQKLPQQMGEFKNSMDSDNHDKFISRKEVKALEARLDDRIDAVPEVIGTQITKMTSTLKEHQNNSINAGIKRIASYLGAGFVAATSLFIAASKFLH